MAPRVYLDTNIFIEAFERTDAEHSPVWSILNAIEAREMCTVTSELTLAELLPKLIADDDAALIAIYKQIFAERTVVDAVPVTRDILIEAAHLRAARMSLPLPDAIHRATAALSRCSVMLSNDQRLLSIGKVPLVPVTADCLSIIRNIGS